MKSSYHDSPLMKLMIKTSQNMQLLLGWEAPSPRQEPPVHLEAVRASYDRLRQVLELDQGSIYGLHTGFGRNIDDDIEPKQWRQHQNELLDYLCVGVGPHLAENIVRRALWIQVSKFSKGLSAIHPETYLALRSYCQAARLPLVPCYGSLGASGDLIPMAHAVREFFHEQGVQGPRDVLATVNTNAMMAAYATECWQRLQKQLRSMFVIGSLTSLALGVRDEAFAPEGLDPTTTQPQMTDIGRYLRLIRQRLLSFTGSTELEGPFPIQERYSVRCMPQILNSLMTKTERAAASICQDATTVSDNPIILTGEQARIWHGGHFYAQGIADASDLMIDACQQLIELIDRQVLLLVTPDTNHGLPTNLAYHGFSHVKGIHQLISALRQQARTLSTRSNQLGFTCESYNQDMVPASMASLNACWQLITLTEEVTRAGTYCADRAFQLRYEQELPDYLSLQKWPEYKPEVTIHEFSETQGLDDF